MQRKIVKQTSRPNIQLLEISPNGRFIICVQRTSRHTYSCYLLHHIELYEANPIIYCLINQGNGDHPRKLQPT